MGALLQLIQVKVGRVGQVGLYPSRLDLLSKLDLNLQPVLMEVQNPTTLAVADPELSHMGSS